MFIFIKRIFYNLLIVLFCLYLFSFFRNVLLKGEYKIKDKYILDKYTHYKSGNFNTLFLGTSLTETGINPIIYDSMSTKIHSYNLGVHGLSTIEYLKLSEFIIQNSKINNNRLKMNNIIFELRSPYHIRGFNLYERRSNITLKDINIIFNICLYQHEIPLYRRALIFTSYIVSYLMNILNIGILSDFAVEKIVKSNINYKGFYNPNSHTNNSIHFKIGKYYNIPKYDSNLLFVQCLEKIIKLAKCNKINIVFWIPPNLPTWEIMDILSFSDYLKDVKIIDANLNKALLNKDIWLDKPHLNLYGARLNTEYLGKVLVPFIK